MSDHPRGHGEATEEMSFQRAHGPSKLSSMLLDPWNPISEKHEEPSLMCLARVQREIYRIYNARRPRGVFVVPEEYDVTKLHAVVVGPKDTPYEAGFFHFLLKCPPDYPASPPRVRNMTTDAGRVRLHPDLYASGTVCLCVLGTCPGQPSWNPTQNSIETVLVSIQSLLNKKTCFEDSGTDDACRYDAVIQHETIRVAVCDVVEACLAGNSPCPPFLRQKILKAFSQHYSWYEKVVGDRVHLDGTVMVGPFGGSKGVYQYRSLLERLRSLYVRLQPRNPTLAGKGSAARF
ncbi:hypothetical protein MTO96_019813 [Rhipicephalus appendiculatus]